MTEHPTSPPVPDSGPTPTRMPCARLPRHRTPRTAPAAPTPPAASAAPATPTASAPPSSPPGPSADAQRARAALLAVRAEVAKAVVGQDAAVSGMLIALLSRGHILLEGVPGVAKTLLVRALAAALDIETKRVQFTPDLMPGDITGSLVYDPRTAEFSFREGPVFTNLLLADEINRTPPKTQASLLEAMEERQVSVDGEPRPLPAPFMVAATQNPVEYEGTYPLPEAQLDRFLLKVVLPLPPARRRGGGAAAARRRVRPARPGRGRLRPVAGAPTSTPARGGARGRGLRPRSPATSSTSPAPPVCRRPCRWASRRAARPRCWPPAARGPGSTAAASSRPTTSRRWPTPRWPTGCRCGPRPSSRASTWARCSRARSARCPSPADGALALALTGLVLALLGLAPVAIGRRASTVRWWLLLSVVLVALDVLLARRPAACSAS